MASIDVRDLNNQRVADLTLDDGVFGVKPNKSVLYEEVRRFLASLRAGTHSTKTRSLVSGGGKKPWKQKGTGRARAGSSRSPLWRGGGTVHGPHPRDYSYDIPKKVKKQAMRVALSDKLRESLLTVVDAIDLREAKTKHVAGLVKTLEVKRNVLVVDAAQNVNLRRAARNHPLVKVVTPSSLNVYDILRYDRLLLSKASVDQITEIFKP